MRYGSMVYGDGTIKTHSPDVFRYLGNGGGGWRHLYSGLRPMNPEREAVVQAEIEQARQRRQAG